MHETETPHSSEHTAQAQTLTIHENPPRSNLTFEKKMILAGIALLVLVAGGLVFWFFRNPKEVTPVDTLADIQKAFLPEVIVTTPTLNTNVVVVSRKELRGGEVRGVTTPPPALPTPYSNSILGISTILPANWQAQEHGKTSVIFINSSNDSIQIQTYNRPGLTLEEIEKQVSQGSSAQNVYRTEFLGFPAIAFSANNLQWRAFIRGNKLFYIMGQNISQEPVSNIIFF